MPAGTAPFRQSVSWPLLTVATAGIALLALGLWGWAKYGTAVFFEMIASGIAACF
jgi:hypothetical protein